MNAYYTFYTTNIHVQSLHYEFISNHLIIIAQILELKKNLVQSLSQILTDLKKK